MHACILNVAHFSVQHSKDGNSYSHHSYRDGYELMDLEPNNNTMSLFITLIVKVMPYAFYKIKSLSSHVYVSGNKSRDSECVVLNNYCWCLQSLLQWKVLVLSGASVYLRFDSFLCYPGSWSWVSTELIGLHSSSHSHGYNYSRWSHSTKLT
jgi:hypothetical protein